MKALTLASLALGAVFLLGASTPAQAAVASQNDSNIVKVGGGHHHRGHHGWRHHRGWDGGGWGWGGPNYYYGGPGYYNSPACIGPLCFF